jgi:hypothetical protein
MMVSFSKISKMTGLFLGGVEKRGGEMMRLRFDGVRLLVVGSFLLLGAALGSLLWSGTHRLNRQTGQKHPATSRSAKSNTDNPSMAEPNFMKDLKALNDPLWIDLNRKLAEMYRKKQFLNAVKTAKAALQTAEKKFGNGHPGMAIAINNLATVYLRQERFDEASWLFSQTRSIVNDWVEQGRYKDLNRVVVPGLLIQSDDYRNWDWPAADFRVARIEPGMSEEEAVKILEETYSEKETPVPGQFQTSSDGKELIYPQFTLHFSGNQVESGLRQIRITGNDTATLRGVRVGDSKWVVLWVYGPPVKEEPGLIEYHSPGGTMENPPERYIQMKLDADMAVREIEIGVR